MLTVSHARHPHRGGGARQKPAGGNSDWLLQELFLYQKDFQKRYLCEALPLGLKRLSIAQRKRSIAKKRLGVIRGDRNSDVKRYFNYGVKEPISDESSVLNLVGRR